MQDSQNSPLPLLLRGVIKENPVLVLLLGLCPFLATTTSVINGLGIGLATVFVLTLVNVTVSILRAIIPSKMRIPFYVVVIAGCVTITQLLIKAYFPTIDKALGIFIPLIAVNCIVLGRIEAFASRARVSDALFDALGMGSGFTLACLAMGAIREVLGAGTFIGYAVPWFYEHPILLFVMPTGGFLVYAFLILAMTTLVRRIERIKTKREAGEPIFAWGQAFEVSAEQGAALAEMRALMSQVKNACSSCAKVSSCNMQQYRELLKPEVLKARDLIFGFGAQYRKVRELGACPEEKRAQEIRAAAMAAAASHGSRQRATAERLVSPQGGGLS